jgi:hypothetical protein
MEKITKRTLPVKLADDEVAIRAQDLATAELERLERTQALEDSVEEWKEQKKTLENAAAASVTESVRLARIVKYCEEPREVTCSVTVANGQYTLTRTDTGEVVAQRAASAEELQMTLEEAAGDAVDDAVDAAIESAADPEPNDDVPTLNSEPQDGPDEDGPAPQSEQ